MGPRLHIVGKLGLTWLLLAGAFARAEGLDPSIHAEGVPPIPSVLTEDLDKFRFIGAAQFNGWLGGSRALLFLAPTSTVHQLFLSRDPAEPATRLTEGDGPIAWVSPHPTRERFVLAYDNGGNEQYMLWYFDLATEEIRPLTQRHARNRYPCWSRGGHFLAYSSDVRDDKDQDLCLIYPRIGGNGRRLKKANGLCVADAWSPDSKRIAAVEYRPNFEQTRVHLIEVESGKIETLPPPDGPPVMRSLIEWSSDGNSLFWLTNKNSEFDRLARYDLATGKETILTEQIPWDVETYDVSDDGKRIILLANEDGYSRLHLLDGPTGQERPAPHFAPGHFSSLSFRRHSHEFAFEWECAQSPGGIFSYDLATKRKTEWVKPRRASGLAGSGSDPVLIRYPSFDGRLIPAFVRYADPRTPGPHPVLIDIHGGPASQYTPGYSSLGEFLSKKYGVVTIHPNIRGSSGYGRNYEELDDGPKRDDAVRDIGALLDWIAAQPGLDASRVAVTGSSYGGYMALASLVKYSDRLAGGIDIAGFSDFETLLKDKRPGDLDARRQEYGDERVPEVLDFLRANSPLANAAKIRKPLLVIHGANDPRVRLREAESIVEAVRKNNVPVWYVRFDGEGHNFENRDHVVYSQCAQVLFLERFLVGPN